MFRMTSTFVAAAVAAISSSAMSDVPFQQLADFGLGCSPSDVNATGVIVGAVRVDGEPGPYVPVIWPTATSQPVELPTVNGGYAVAINSNGDIVGTEFQPAGIYGVAVLWSNGERIELPDLGEGAFAVDINESGVIAGNVIVNGEYRAARWVDRELEVLALPPFDVGGGQLWSFASSINSAGVITGTIQAPVATPSAALRWDSEGVAFVQSDGLETKGISINNQGGVLINGYFDGGSSRAPAIVGADGTVSVLPSPTGLFGGAATTMGRNGVAAGYYYGSGPAGEFQIKAAAWPNGEFTPLAMPEGQRYAFPGAVGMNGMVFGGATDGVSGLSVGGFWQLEIEEGFLQSSTVSGERGETVELSATSLTAAGANVGYSVSVRVNGRTVGQAITDEFGVARVAYTIPAKGKGSQLAVEFVDETGAAIAASIEIVTGCVVADLNCDNRVNAQDLAVLLSSWGQSGAADLNADGFVGAADLSVLLSGWTG
jgi:hypothetical protein